MGSELLLELAIGPIRQRSDFGRQEIWSLTYDRLSVSYFFDNTPPAFSTIPDLAGGHVRWFAMPPDPSGYAWRFEYSPVELQPLCATRQLRLPQLRDTQGRADHKRRRQ